MRAFVAVAWVMSVSVRALGGPAPIIGGTAVEPGELDSVVAIYVNDGDNTKSYSCTGTLVTQDWVLTSAKCIVGNASRVELHFHTTDLGLSSGVVRTASRVLVNPGFSPTAYGPNDIGLIQLSEPITDIAPMPVNLVAANAPIGVAVASIGFGSGTERAVPQTSIGCEAITRQLDPDLVVTDTRALCFGTGDNNEGTDQLGDVGGPSLAMIEGRLVQVGVITTSWNPYAYDVDSRTDSQSAFLLENVPELHGCAQDADCPLDRTCFRDSCITPPLTARGLGSTCATGDDCDSLICASSNDVQVCSMSCVVARGSCPDGFDCLERDDHRGGGCWPSDGGRLSFGGVGIGLSGVGCSAGRPDSSLFGLLWVGLLVRRRRRGHMPRRSPVNR